MIEDRVVWTEKEEEEDRYRIAIHFPSSRRAIYVYLNIYMWRDGYQWLVTRDQLPRPNSSGIRIEARVAAAAFSRAVCQTGGEDIRGHIFLPGKRTRSRGKTLANNEDKGGGEEGGKGGEEEERKKTESEKKRLKVL